MNDLDQLREFRAEIPYPERPRLSPGRSRLLAAARRPQRRRFTVTRRSPLLLTATAAAAAIAVAAGLAGYGLSTGSAPAATPRPRPPQSRTQPGGARRAHPANASAAASRVPPKTTPSPGQWIYSKLVGYQYPQGTSSNENWITFDGTESAYYESRGGPITVHTSPMAPPADIKSDPLAAFNTDATPQTAYYALASLPTAPGQLLAALDKVAQSVGAANLTAGTPVASHAPKNKGQLEFDYLSLLLWNAAGGVGAPPNAEAAAFRAMAAIPGVTVQQGITDAAGNPAIGVSDDGGYDQLLLDPVSYQVTGLRQLSNGIGPKMAAPSPQQLAGYPKAMQQQSCGSSRTQRGHLRAPSSSRSPTRRSARSAVPALRKVTASGPSGAGAEDDADRGSGDRADGGPERGGPQPWRPDRSAASPARRNGWYRMSPCLSWPASEMRVQIRQRSREQRPQPLRRLAARLPEPPDRQLVRIEDPVDQPGQSGHGQRRVRNEPRRPPRVQHTRRAVKLVVPGDERIVDHLHGNTGRPDGHPGQSFDRQHAAHRRQATWGTRR